MRDAWLNMDKVKIRSSNLFPVVGIGASAGGLDAFKRLLKAIPADSGMAYILVQHLDPAHESILADLLQKITKIPIQEITDNIHVAPDHIYIIPSNKLLTASDGILQLSPRLPRNQKNMPIDVFFTSLAEVHQHQAIGIVLSGTGTDGTLGMKDIKEHGGTTFAQQPASAAYDSMPQSAIDANVADFILSPEAMPKQLMLLGDTKRDGSSTPSAEEGYRQILSLLHIRRGVDFTHYKQTTIRRRMARRISLSMKESIGEYLVYLKENKAEQDNLYQDLLIPVTQFFRDPDIFEKLRETVIPLLAKSKSANEPIRIWIAGCSTGEEAYSIVMCLHEYLGEQAAVTPIQVFATDISEIAIDKARTGIYKKSEVSGVSASRLQKFFTKTDNKFRLHKSIRDACIFACHNYLKDPPFAKMDLISCRNSLIYVEPVLQKKALTIFHYALKDKGILILGKSETTGPAAELYNVLDNHAKIYTRKAIPGKFMHMIPDRKEEVFKGLTYGSTRNESAKDDFQKNADEIILSRYAPPGVIVNDQLEIVQFRGATGRWLEPSPGKPDLNVLKMAREGLAFELRNTLHKAKSSKAAMIKSDIPFLFTDTEYLVTIEVIPLLNTIEPHYLILFKDTAISSEQPDTTDTPKQSKDRARIQSLQKELAQVREDMRNISGAQQATNEELQSANEELLSGSEELQSLNEELETSKEEIQTSNEELIIVNQEISDRNEQLDLSRLYAESIVTTIREPFIILNKNLEVKSANQPFYNIFHATEEGIVGKHLFEFNNKQWNIPGLRKMLEKILPEKTNIVDFEVIHSFPVLGERMMLLNASRILRDHNEEQLILLAIEDITVKRKLEKEVQLFTDELEKQVSERTFSLHEANVKLLHSNENLKQFAYIASHDLQEPLRKIRTFSSTLNDRFTKDLPEKAQELISKILASAERMSNLIKEVLNFSRILHGDVPFDKIDLNEVLTQVINDFDLLIHEKNVVIYREQLPVIEAIPVQISQLFYNLISNSIKFSRKDTPLLIHISASKLTKEAQKKMVGLHAKLSYYVISFKDNGIGFEPQYADQIFLIFHRLNNVEEYAGTGIGLALCKKIVVNHQGEIYGISKNQDGATFQIVLPVTQGLPVTSPKK